MAELIETIQTLLEPLLEGTDMFIVDIKVKPINNIKVFLDADTGLSVEKSARTNRKLYHLIEDLQLFPDGDFSLEVSSPGVDEPLLRPRQYTKNINRTVLLTLNDGEEKLGVLKEVTDEHFILETKVPKKKETVTIEVPIADIKKTVVQIIF